jgi:hypothetical protein
MVYMDIGAWEPIQRINTYYPGTQDAHSLPGGQAEFL